MSAARPGAVRDPYVAMLRGGAVPALAVAVVALVVWVVLDGGPGAAGSLLATGVVVGSFSTSLLVLRRTARSDPRVAFLAAMVGYTSTVLFLGLLLVLLRDAPWLSPLAFAVTAVVVSLAWTTGQVIAFTRVRTLVYDASPDDPGGPGAAR